MTQHEHFFDTPFYGCGHHWFKSDFDDDEIYFVCDFCKVTFAERALAGMTQAQLVCDNIVDPECGHYVDVDVYGGGLWCVYCGVNF